MLLRNPLLKETKDVHHSLLNQSSQFIKVVHLIESKNQPTFKLAFSLELLLYGYHLSHDSPETSKVQMMP